LATNSLLCSTGATVGAFSLEGAPFMRIPYGISDFATIRREGYFYVDKTPFLSVLENSMFGYSYVVFLRPRRFGKSTIISMLSHYYDIAKADQFDALFKGLWIHDHPTEFRNKFLILWLDFSQVATGRGPEALFRTFLEVIRAGVKKFILRYGDRIPNLEAFLQRLDSYVDPEAILGRLLSVLKSSGHQLYVLIDEYDHFANRLLAAGDENAYDTIIEDTGFMRSFYATLKSGTGTGTVARLFMTGVTPLMLDDMSSGFNITSNISMSPRFETFAGFTSTDVERAIDEFVVARPELQSEMADRQKLFETLKIYYDGYRFSSNATEGLFNSDMVLYFLRELSEHNGFPRELLDRNVRTAYEHLGHVGASGSDVMEERQTIFETILSERSIQSPIVEQFGVKLLETSSSFISLLYYLGMLTQRVKSQATGQEELEIPNRVIRELQWEHLAKHLDRQAKFAIDTGHLASALENMGVRGDIAPLLQLFHTQIIQHFGIKDTRKLDERTIKLLFMMYVSLGKVFYALSEKEFSQGYCDLFLAAAPNLPGLRYSWLIEFKYLETNAKEPAIEAAFAAAAAQVERYSKDAMLLPLLVGKQELLCGTMVFVGTKRLLFRSWPNDVPERRVEVVGKAAKKTTSKKSKKKS